MQKVDLAEEQRFARTVPGLDTDRCPSGTGSRLV